MKPEGRADHRAATGSRPQPEVGRHRSRSPHNKMAAPGTAAGAVTTTAAAALVQYVVLRGDLARSWSLGAVVAQGCHAALAAAHAHWQHPDTRAYLCMGGAMRTVVLEAPDEAALTTLAQTLKEHSIDHEVWTEQPENIPSCLALRPYPKDQVHPHLKKFKLLK
ncbi:putative peptidyl-tRNA hydrolase PTRHD1 [Coturnix japonica]|nr:putative peptidyl-tRNA hydrolase PTRHD1 [Coturnix japonica]